MGERHARAGVCSPLATAAGVAACRDSQRSGLGRTVLQRVPNTDSASSCKQMRSEDGMREKPAFEEDLASDQHETLMWQLPVAAPLVTALGYMNLCCSMGLWRSAELPSSLVLVHLLPKLLPTTSTSKPPSPIFRLRLLVIKIRYRVFVAAGDFQWASDCFVVSACGFMGDFRWASGYF